jgi:hypothetical protein
MLPAFIKFGVFSGFNTENVDSDDQKATIESPTAETLTVFSSTDESASLVSNLSDIVDFSSPRSIRFSQWNKSTRYSEFIQSGMRYLKKDDSNVVMLFEAPSSSSSESTFFNCAVYRFHDYPPYSQSFKTMLGPSRYSMMNGTTYPSYLEAGSPPERLLAHWETVVPGFERPLFVSTVDDDAQVYAYLPCESIKNHVNDPHTHYHIAGKDALSLMTDKTTKMLPTTAVRPCIVKTTHSMGSKGIFIIRNDQDDAEFQEFLKASGNPTYVVTELVDIHRNVAAHFFIHPSGEVTFFGSNENHKRPDGSWSMDSYLNMQDQEVLQEMQLPYVKDVVQYCLSLGFWGHCGVDVLFDINGKGYLVDVNPRVTGSCPSLMVAQLLKDKYGFEKGLFRRNGPITFCGCQDDLFDQVDAYNVEHEGLSQIVLFGVFQESDNSTQINIGIYGNDMAELEVVLNRFAQI